MKLSSPRSQTQCYHPALLVLVRKVPSILFVLAKELRDNSVVYFMTLSDAIMRMYYHALLLFYNMLLYKLRSIYDNKLINYLILRLNRVFHWIKH